jgi:hypothetical protein
MSNKGRLGAICVLFPIVATACASDDPAGKVASANSVDEKTNDDVCEGAGTVGTDGQGIIDLGDIDDGEQAIDLGDIDDLVDAGGAGSSGNGTTCSSGTCPTIRLCGLVNKFVAPTSSSNGLVNISGHDLPLTQGCRGLTGELLNTLRPGANLCVDGVIDDATGLVASISSVVENTSGGVLDQATDLLAGIRSTADNICASGSVHVCGSLSSCTLASSDSSGLLMVGGCEFDLAPASMLSGSEALSTGSWVCVDGSLDSDGTITAGAISAAN